MATVGYARTSTIEQQAGLDAQIRDLKAAGAERIYSEQVSSVGKRPVLDECLADLKEGDVLIVTKPDRLARSVANLLGIVEDLHARKIGLVLLSMGGERYDTRSPTSRLMLTILGAVAEFERLLMLERQKEGIAKAKSEGKFTGRPRSIDRARVREVAAEKGPVKAARELGISRVQVFRILKEAA